MASGAGKPLVKEKVGVLHPVGLRPACGGPCLGLSVCVNLSLNELGREDGVGILFAGFIFSTTPLAPPNDNLNIKVSLKQSPPSLPHLPKKQLL